MWGWIWEIFLALAQEKRSKEARARTARNALASPSSSSDMGKRCGSMMCDGREVLDDRVGENGS